MANVINLLNPALIIISGEGVRAGDFLFRPMHEALGKHTFSSLIRGVEIRIDPLEDDAWARGAASLVLDGVFSTSQWDAAPAPVS
jgi:predicted NBD/HSP70 family sugar kinase